ncbi:hypothetical protein GCM10023194_80670 [Planotetraspora phitsanulokensis]|uniref:Anti-sigma factor antagonist n=1 Tax=Planotetraspora phitsanulokensis TaxID=575192 RepID=A0A8J3UA62_9ACTN|nr:STAS domain-containing protein [Planotetraspora phitsanulokensis]GII41604.1 hypothetical protein Pph01_66070 [Planotetraspora phitsanulokensis]
MGRDPGTRAEVQSWQLGYTRVLRLVGELDAVTVPDLRLTLDEAITSDDPSLVVDLTQVTFIASAGVGVLVELRVRVSEHDGRLIVVLPRVGRARRMFEVTRIVDHFEIRETVEDAVRSLRDASDPAQAPVTTELER